MTEQRFCLRWNHHQTTLINVFDSLLKDESLVDVTLYAEGRPVKAHKVVLSACSQYFKAIFSAHTESHPVIIINNVLHSELRALVDYMYRGEVNVCQDQLSSFIKAAESLKIKGLADGSERRAPVSAPPSPPPPPPVPFQTLPARAASPRSVRDSPVPLPLTGQPNGRVSPPPAKRPRPASVDGAPPAGAALWEPAARPASAEERSETARSPGSGAGLPRIPATITPLAAGRPAEQPSPPPIGAPPLPPPPPQPTAAEPEPPAGMKEEHPDNSHMKDEGAEDNESDPETDGMDGGDPGPSGHSLPQTPPHPAAMPPGFLNWPLGGADSAEGPFGGGVATSEAGTPQGAVCAPRGVRELLARRPAAAAVREWVAGMLPRLPPPPPPPPAPLPTPSQLPVSCERCGRAYATTSSLNRHLRYECGQPPQFACPVCMMPFKHKHNMHAYIQQALFRRLLEQRRYEQLMARAPPPPPPPGAGLGPSPGPIPGLVRGLSLPPMLRPGMVSSPARQYNCERCGRQYTSSGNLKRHVKYECGVEPQFQCPVCKKKFQHRHSVKIHVVSTHKSENPELIREYLT
ncbi:Longitudinals lacking protein, isoforms H/M/V [Amphibalanus amphitrite]|uniref:Longitudinals lacking protein, isoforms H/M/V n=1 Tax=Amphibalanus amphitrite TaxID=1232801 RepID=A0A6A4WY23_AMPAM|nr:Longitudinals lacking protein, isoforms H/M/V [Amphibalanus amphitrite]